jgi:two-component system sensor histidine kinase KdpD
LTDKRQVDQILQAVTRHISDMFESRIVILLPVASKRIQPWGTISGWWAQPEAIKYVFAPDLSEQGVAQWVFTHVKPAGLGTTTLPSSEALYLPLSSAERTIGVLGVRPAHPARLLEPDQRRLLNACIDQAAQAIERALLTTEAEQARVSAETERTRSALLSAVSHDLRTPLTVISGASETLRDQTLPANTRAELTATVADEAARLSRLVNNLLEMTRIESGALQLRRELQPIEEVVGAALSRITEETHPIQVSMQPNLPMVAIDAVLIEQVLVNLLDNAQRYTPPGTLIELRVRQEDHAFIVEVADRGVGLPSGAEQRVFEKFYRGNASDRDGSGLGLAICRSMVEAHGGTISAENRADGGALFQFSLPL